MITFKQYVKESDDIIEQAAHDAMEYIKNHCSDALWMLEDGKEPLWRGMSASYSAGGRVVSEAAQNGWTVSASPKNRRSANTTNFYTAIMDANPLLKDYPKRSESWICSSNYDTADGFGTGRPYAMIPVNGAKIGVCNGADLWNIRILLSPELKPARINDVNNMWSDLLGMMRKDKATSMSNSNIDGSTIKEFLADVQKYVSTGDGAIKFCKALVYADMINLSEQPSPEKAISIAESVLHNLWVGYGPDTLVWQLLTVPQCKSQLPDDREVWTDSDMVIITHNVWGKMKRDFFYANL